MTRAIYFDPEHPVRVHHEELFRRALAGYDEPAETNPAMTETTP